MADNTSFLALLMEELLKLVEPLLVISDEIEELAEGGTTDDIPETLRGMLINVGLDTDLLGSALNGVLNSIKQVSLLESLIEKLQHPPASLDEVSQLLDDAAQALNGIQSIGSLLSAELEAPNLEGIAEALIEHLFARYLASYYPAVWALLVMLAVADDAQSDLTLEGGDNVLIPHVRIRLQFERLATLLRNPLSHLRTEYVRDADLDTFAGTHAVLDRFLPRFEQFLYSLNISSIYNPGVETTAAPTDQLMSRILLVSLPPLLLEGVMINNRLGITLAPKIGVLIVPSIQTGDLGRTFGQWKLSLVLQGSSAAFAIGKDGVVLETNTAGLSLDASLKRLADVSGHAFVIGGETSTHLTIGQFSIATVAAVQASGYSIDIQLQASSGEFVVQAGDGDSFMSALLPSDGLRAAFDLGIGWSNQRGFYFKGSGGLETTYSLNKTIGPFRVDSATLAIRAEASTTAARPALRVEFGVSGGAALGPLQVNVDRIGLQSTLRLSPGNLGALDLVFGFKPPTGLGLLIEAGPVKGGGYISLDAQAGRYAGVLQLDLAGIVSITAVALLDTQVPGGGYSFLLILTFTFPPIQLGFGITLNGVGGLVGIQRGVDERALQDGVRAGILDSVLFPTNPLANPMELVKNVGTLFPVRAAQYVFGPFVKLGWGTPTIIEAQLGILLELPSPLVITLLGQIDIYLPKREAAVVELHLDVAGRLDLTNGRLSIDASLHRSRIGIFNVSGDMALRIAWGNEPVFALAVGGFNPAFTPPPGFPTLRRLALGLGKNPRISIEAYFALTANTLQFGASADLYASAEGFELRGWLYFDALFIFDPFSFRIDTGAGLSVSKGSWVLFEIRLDFTLTGPRPWRLVGTAVFHVIVEIRVPIAIQVGEEPEHDDTTAKDPLVVAFDAFSLKQNWSGSLLEGTQPIVLSDAASSLTSLIDPGATLVARQRSVPLQEDIDILVRPLAAREKVDVGPTSGDQIVAVLDYFDLSHRVMTRDEKLSSPSFVQMKSGFTFAVVGGKSDETVNSVFDYEVRVVDQSPPTEALPILRLYDGTPPRLEATPMVKLTLSLA